METRRRFLRLATAVAGGALAGCSSGEETTSPTASTTVLPTTASTPTNTVALTTTTAQPATTTADDTTATVSVNPETVETWSRAFLEGLVAGEYEWLLTEFSFTPAVAEQLDATRLRDVWTSQTGSLGQFVEVASFDYTQSQGYHVGILTARFASGQLLVQLAYDDSGRIASLFFRPPGTDESYSPPGYADRSAFVEAETTVQATDACSLPARFTFPAGEDTVPGVVLVHGSGPNDMDQTIGPNKPFKDLAWGLASQGIGVLRYDKRTFACDVDLAALTVDQKVTDDALEALSVLRGHPRIDAERSVVVGHSIGAMLAPRITERDEALAGAIMLAAPARPLTTLIQVQTEYLLALDGSLSETDTERLAELEATVERIQSLDIADDEVVFGLGGRPFWESIQTYDQVATAQALDRPLAILQGERDYQVTMTDFQQWQSALGDRETVTFSSYPALNHLFMPGEGPARPTAYFQPNNVDRMVVEDVAARVTSMVQ